MDALMAALLVAALGSVGDRPPWLAAILADRARSPVAVIAAALVGIAAAAAIAAAIGATLGPRFTPEAKDLMLALALALQGGGALFAVKPPDRLSGWRIGTVATAGAGLFILAFGDGIQFVVLVLAARTPIPALAAIGGTLGSGAVVAGAALAGEAAWLRLPLLGLRRVVAALFLAAALWIGLGALRLA